MRRTARALLLVLLVLVVLAVVMWTVQRRLLYFPGGAPPAVEATLPGGEAVTVPTDDGLELQAWWLPRGETAVVVLPGNAGNRAVRVPLARALGDLGLSVLLVDYRGYGGNPGAPSEAGLLDDGRAAFDWVAARRDVADVVLFGESLGAAVAIAVATERDPAALVLRSPFTSLLEMARTHYGPVPGFLLRDRYPSADRIHAVEAPLLVVAGEDDRIVPLEHSRRLFDRAHEPGRFVTVPGAGHNDAALLDGPVLVDAVRAFLADHGL